MANTSKKLTELKERFKDKSLTRSQRQELYKEIIEERYRTDPRPVLSIREYHKRRAIVGTIGLISGITGIVALSMDKEANKTPGIIILVIFSVIALLILGILIWCVIPFITHKVERGDELYKQNDSKANEYTAATLAVFGFSLAMILSMSSWKFSISNKNIMFVAFAVYGLVGALKSFAMLKLETACPEEGDEEDEN